MTSDIPDILLTLVFVLNNQCSRIKGRREGPVLSSRRTNKERLRITWTNAGGHAIYDAGFQQLDCWDREFESL